jgi:hypothetical protein
MRSDVSMMSLRAHEKTSRGHGGALWLSPSWQVLQRCSALLQLGLRRARAEGIEMGLHPL